MLQRLGHSSVSCKLIQIFTVLALELNKSQVSSNFSLWWCCYCAKLRMIYGEYLKKWHDFLNFPWLFAFSLTQKLQAHLFSHSLRFSPPCTSLLSTEIRSRLHKENSSKPGGFYHTYLYFLFDWTPLASKMKLTISLSKFIKYYLAFPCFQWFCFFFHASRSTSKNLHWTNKTMLSL